MPPPLDTELHLELATWYLTNGNPATAFSEIRTAAFLGAESARCQALEQKIVAVLPPLLELSHNRYYRMHTLAQAIRRMANGTRVSVLDVGGGHGELAQFLPDVDYCLAEPTVNGIAGEALPFADASFDIVVSCHVLEHIPLADRPMFLDTLMSKARTGVILLNPFQVDGTNEVERLQLVVDLTGFSWAQEHLDCVLPRTEDVEAYANSRGLICRLTPNATIPVSFGFVWVDYFSHRAKLVDAWKRINRYMNTQMVERVDSTELPTAYLVELTRASKTRRTNGKKKRDQGRGKRKRGTTGGNRGGGEGGRGGREREARERREDAVSLGDVQCGP